MSSTTRRLGDVVGAFRRRAGLTQRQLAEQLGAPVNRSLIAHLEQGRRLPSIDVLTRLCRMLEVPEDVWQPFLASGFQRVRTSAFPKGKRLRPFQQLVVCGSNGSGKTTLARALARALSIPCVPFEPHGRDYLGDLSKDPGRWAFETQVAFLSEKAIQLRHFLEQGQPVVVDRSVSEDAYVYAKYFIDSGAIDSRAAETFSMMTEHFLDGLPEPDLAIYCACTVDVASERVASRNREDRTLLLHSRERLEALDRLYSEWLALHAPSNLYQIDSGAVDFLDPIQMEQIFHDVQELLADTASSDQLSLFQSQVEYESPQPCSILRPVSRGYIRTQPIRIPRAVYGSSSLIAPRAYVAAPFTAIASAVSSGTTDTSDVLFPESSPHGVIPKGGYRTILLGIERVLASWGVAAIVPHRDVNEWGLRTLTPSEAMKGCTEHVQSCDLFIGILGNSCGSHYEFGLALGLRKPCIILLPRKMSASFLSQGVGALSASELKVVVFEDLEDAVRSMNTENVREFILHNVEGSGRSVDVEDLND